MKKIYTAGIIIFLAVISIFLIKKTESEPKTKPITIVNHLFYVEVADTDEKRSRGLSNRDKIGQNEGMLFTFSSPSYYPFWMKEMKFPLDFIWVNDKTIVDLKENVPEPKTISETPLIVISEYRFDKVIEFNAGVIKTFNIKIGDRILL